MTTEIRKELSAKGIRLVPLWQFVWIIIIALVSLGISYGIQITRITQIEQDIKVLNEWREGIRITEVEDIRILENRLTKIEQKLDYVIEKMK